MDPFSTPQCSPIFHLFLCIHNSALVLEDFSTCVCASYNLQFFNTIFFCFGTSKLPFSNHDSANFTTCCIRSIVKSCVRTKTLKPKLKYHNIHFIDFVPRNSKLHRITNLYADALKHPPFFSSGFSRPKQVLYLGPCILYSAVFQLNLLSFPDLQSSFFSSAIPRTLPRL